MTETLGEWERRTGFDRTANEIDGLPVIIERVKQLVAAELTKPVEPVTLMERGICGERVELRWSSETGTVAIVVENGGELRGANIPPEKALDAFNHPYVYLPA